MTNLTDIRKTKATTAGIGISVFDSVGALPSTGLTSGDQAFVESAGEAGTSRLYISNGSRLPLNNFATIYGDLLTISIIGCLCLL